MMGRLDHLVSHFVLGRFGFSELAGQTLGLVLQFAQFLVPGLNLLLDLALVKLQPAQGRLRSRA